MQDRTERAGALAKREAALPEKPLATVAELGDALERLSKTANVVSPIARVDSLPPMTQVSLRVVRIDPDLGENGQGPDVYFDRRFCATDNDGNPLEVALGKGALLKLVAAAGIQKRDSRRDDDGRDPYFCRWVVRLEGLDYDGTLREVVASKEIDLREGSPDTTKPEWACSAHGDADCRKCNRRAYRKTGRLVPLDASALADKRRHIAALAETKAYLRAVREFFSIGHKVKLAKLEKPFVVPKLVPFLDASDPDVKREIVRRAVWGERALYAPETPRPTRRVEVGGDLERLDDDLEDLTPETAGDSSDKPTATQRSAGHGARSGSDRTSSAGAAGVSSGRPARILEPEIVDNDPFGVEEAEEAEPSGPRCSCPCGCRDAVDEAQERKSSARLGVVRCAACYPDAGFDPAKHPREDLPLEFPRVPGYTPAKVAELLARRAKREGAQ